MVHALVADWSICMSITVTSYCC